MSDESCSNVKGHTDSRVYALVTGALAHTLAHNLRCHWTWITFFICTLMKLFLPEPWRQKVEIYMTMRRARTASASACPEEEASVESYQRCPITTEHRCPLKTVLLTVSFTMSLLPSSSSFVPSFLHVRTARPNGPRRKLWQCSDDSVCSDMKDRPSESEHYRHYLACFSSLHRLKKKKVSPHQWCSCQQ